MQFTYSLFYLSMAGAFAISLIVHELAHYFMMVDEVPDVKITFGRENGRLRCKTGEQAQYERLSPQAKQEIYALGIIMGLFVFVACWMLIDWRYLLLVYPYCIIVMNDLKLLVNSIKEHGWQIKLDDKEGDTQ